MARREPGDAAPPLTRLVELPGRGTTRIWECPGPPGAETLLLVHGVAVTSELNWGKVIAPLARHFRVIAVDQRGHGDGISARTPFRLEDCADDMAALMAVLEIGSFIAVGYSMGGMICQLLYRRHPALVTGLVLCCTARDIRGSHAEELAAFILPAVAAAVHWNPLLQLQSAEMIGAGLLGHLTDPATTVWAREQMRRTSLAAAVSAMQAVCGFTSQDWIGQVDVPVAVVVTARDQIVPAQRQRALALAIPGASIHEVDADHGACINAAHVFAGALLDACWSVSSARKGPRPGSVAAAECGLPG